MTLNIRDTDKYKFIESNDLIVNKSISKFNKELLYKRKFELVSEIFALTSFFELNKNSFNCVSELILLILRAPETIFLDKIFSNPKIYYKKEIHLQSIPIIVKKIHSILNYISLPEKLKLKHLEFVRSLIKFYTKNVVNCR